MKNDSILHGYTMVEENGIGDSDIQYKKQVVVNWSILLVFLTIFVVSGMRSYGQGRVTRQPKHHTVKKSPTVNISEPDDYFNNHGYVDLGLPSGTLWSTCNIGANSPTDLGTQYAWGEISPKTEYTEENSLWQGKECEDIGGNPEFDAATATWGEHWRLPTHEQIQELDEKCKWIYTTKNGVRGFIIIGPNNKNIFLSSRKSISEWSYGTYVCSYWSSTPNKRDFTITDIMSSAVGINSNNKRFAYCITSSDNSAWIASGSKYYGYGVRPVYCDSVYKEKPNFIRPEGRTYGGRGEVFKISGCWMVPSYSYVYSKDSGDIVVDVKFDKEGNVTSVSMKAFGPISNNEETQKAIEAEIRSTKMSPMPYSKIPIPDESIAKIRYEFR